MPTIKRKKIHVSKSRNRLTHDQICHLLYGDCLDGVKPDYHMGSGERWRMSFPFKDDDHRRQMWTENEDFLMDYIGKEPKEYCFFARPIEKPEDISGYRDYE